MIFLGLDDAAKDAEIVRTCAEHGITKVVILSPSKYRRPCSFPAHEHVEWADVITYVFYYRLLQEIGPSTLVVVNECLRTQNRYELAYNCIRLFLAQTPHVLVFQYLPLIDTFDDFAALFDLDTKSRWKREKIGPSRLGEATIRVAPVPLELRAVEVPTDAKTRAAYTREKRRLIDGIGLKDPHTIPRNLYLMSGRAKMAHVAAARARAYVGRNDRFKLDRFATYKELVYPAAPYTVFELPHAFLDFVDFLALSRQTSLDVLVADLKVDRWYFERYQAWAARLREAYAALGSST